MYDKIRHGGSHAYMRGLLPHFRHTRFSQDLQTKTWHWQFTLFVFITVCQGLRRHLTPNNKMKKAESFLLGLFTAILFLTLSVSCSDSDSEPSPTPTPSPSPTPTSDYAPKNMIGKKFRFYNTGEDNYEFEVIAAEHPSDAKFQLHRLI